MPRPTKLTPVMRERVATHLARGTTHKSTARQLGISVDALDRWLARANRADHARRQGRKVSANERPYLDLFDELLDAENEAELRALREIMQQVTVAAVDLDTAARAAGVPFPMLERLENRATQVSNRRDDGERLDDEEREYLQLFDGLLQSGAQMKVTAIAAVRREMVADWRAAAFFLERRYPEEWGHPNRRKDSNPARGGRPVGATSAPDRPASSDPAPPRIRLREVR